MASSNTLGENTLGLDLEQANISSPPSTENKSAPVQTAPLKATEVPSSTAAPPSAPDAVPASPSNAEPREKKKPYVNPDRAATGGSQRVSAQYALTAARNQMTHAYLRISLAMKHLRNVCHVYARTTRRLGSVN